MANGTLIEQILNRNRRALHIFYHTYTPRLARRITTKIANPKDAEEVLQDTLFAFLEAIRDYTGRSSVETFLFAICNHKIIDYYRRKKILHTVFSKTPNLEALVSPILNPEEILDATLMKEKVRAVLGRMIPQYRQVLKLRYLDNLSVAEVAQRLTTTIKSVESQLFRARKAFVEAFLSL
ncbi:sigma-70 family RNA polymerase sigma factor [Candidatus Gottesmanbacteria bacterium]|nr:sigma-70 family RNA polymerase sigma factor [Candidatus Gottesmanbacteria bacterium]